MLFLVVLADCANLNMVVDIRCKGAPVEVLGNGLGGAQFSGMSKHGVVPGNDLGLE